MTVALVMFFNLSESSKEGFFRKKVKEAFAFTIVLEFIIGFYPFSLPIELVIRECKLNCVTDVPQ